jgi:4-coumarate--CoA ligase
MNLTFGSFISALSTTDDFIHCFSICRPRVVFVDHQLRERANSALMKISGLENSEIIILGHSELSGISSVCILCNKLRNSRVIQLQYPKDFSSDNKLPVFNLTQDDNRKHTAVVCFSSGTSSKPKGVELSHFNLIASLVGIRASDPVFYNRTTEECFFPLCATYIVTFHSKSSISFEILLSLFLQDSTQLPSCQHGSVRTSC